MWDNRADRGRQSRDAITMDSIADQSAIVKPAPDRLVIEFANGPLEADREMLLWETGNKNPRCGNRGLRATPVCRTSSGKSRVKRP